MNISLRSKTIASFIKKNSKVADIGCDHALLSIYLLKNKVVSKIIASDININALKQGRENIKKHNLQNYIILKLGDGLEVIDDNDIDTIVISGLGGGTIVNILNNDKEKLKNIDNIILQPNNNTYDVRKALCLLGYYIANEKLIKENNIIYTIIAFAKGSVKYSYKDLYFGPLLIQKKDLLFKELHYTRLKKLIDTYQKIPYKYIVKKFKLLKRINFIKQDLI